MIRFDKTDDRDVLAVCSCGWRHHAVGVRASMAATDAAHAHVGGPAHNVDELERRQSMNTLTTRQRRDTPGG